MEGSPTLVLYFLLMVALVIAVDLLFFRHRFRARLISNIGIVSVFLLFYLIFLRRT